MGNLPVGHHRLGQNAVHVQAAAHSCEDVLQNTQTLGFFNQILANNNSLILPSSPFRWWPDAEWTSHWVWERPIVFRPAHRLATPPTECAHRPGCSSQQHPTRSTRLHGSRWRRARLRKTWCRYEPKGWHVIFSGDSVIPGRRTINIDKRPNLVLVVRQTSDLSHR